MKNKLVDPLFFEEPTVAGESSVTMMENTALCHVPVGTVFQSDCEPLHFCCRVCAFLDREFPDHWIGSR